MTERALEQERQRRARLANMRHELLAPVTALVGYELLIEKARGLGLEDIGADLQRIPDLGPRVARADRPTARGGRCGRPPIRRRFQRASGQAAARSAQPLNAIKGYAELLLEELDEEVDAAASTWYFSAKRTVSCRGST